MALNLEHVFSYHPATKEQQVKYEAIRQCAKTMAECILKNTPLCADQTTAIRKLRESVMFANASIALDGLLFEEI